MSNLPGVFSNGKAVGLLKPCEVLQLHRHALILGQPFLMPQEKIPVMNGERAGARPSSFPGAVATARAVVAHALNILAGGHIRLLRHQSAVRVLEHSQGVGQFDPFHGVLLSVESIKTGRVTIQLVADNNDQIPWPAFGINIHGCYRIAVTDWRACAPARHSAKRPRFRPRLRI